MPIHSGKVKNEDINNKLLRSGIRAELEAINIYEQMAALTNNVAHRNIFLDMVKEEKAHMGKLYALLLIEDKEQEKELEEGRKNIEEISSSPKAAVKPEKEHKTTKSAHSASETEKPQETQKPVRPVYSTVKSEKPRQVFHRDTKDTEKTVGNLGIGTDTMCVSCGYKAKGITPNRCPICGAPGESFKRL